MLISCRETVRKMLKELDPQGVEERRRRRLKRRVYRCKVYYVNPWYILFCCAYMFRISNILIIQCRVQIKYGISMVTINCLLMASQYMDALMGIIAHRSIIWMMANAYSYIQLFPQGTVDEASTQQPQLSSDCTTLLKSVLKVLKVWQSIPKFITCIPAWMQDVPKFCDVTMALRNPS